MDDIVALSNSFRDRHRATTPKTIDDIPTLTHTLGQLHKDSTRILPSQPPPIYSAALRLFSTLDFDTHRLHSAVSSLDSSLFSDRFSPPFPSLRHPLWLADRAADDARLSNTTPIRTFFQNNLLADIHRANTRLHTNITQINNAFDSRTPVSSAYNRCDSNSATPTHPSVSSTPYPHPATLVVPYIETIRAIALHGESHSAATLMHETAASVPEPPHFIEALAIISSVVRHANPGTSPPQHLVVWGARVVLEDLFAEHIGGLPSKPRLATGAAILPRIYEYVRGVVPRGTDKIWPCVYFCLRIGHVEAALHALREASSQRNGGFETIITIIEAFLKGRDRIRRRHAAQSAANRPGHHVTDSSSIEGCASMIPGFLGATELYQELEREYRNVAWDSNNPYMRVSYVLLMRLELQTEFRSSSERGNSERGNSNRDMSRHPQSNRHERFSLSLSETDISLLLGSVEDYLWFRLWLCRTDFELSLAGAPPNSSVVHLDSIQQDIKSFGSEYFDPEGSQPLLFAFVLVTIGLYETGVSYFAHHAEEIWSHYAVHLGIVLYQLRWLSDEETFHKLMRSYVMQFSNLYPTEAALYFMTMRNCDALMASLKDLILTTKEFDQLLGRSNTTNSDGDGVLVHLIQSASAPLPSRFSGDDLRKLRVDVATVSAMEFQQKGDFASAAKLFALAEKRTEALDMVLRNLSVELYKLSSPKRSVAVMEAKNGLNLLDGDLESINPSLRAALPLLVKMSQIFEEYWTGRYAGAWNEMRDVHVLPFSSERISQCHREITSELSVWHPCVRKPAEELLKIALHIAEYALETGNVASTNDSSPSRTRPGSFVDILKPCISEIKSLCIFAGLVGLKDREAQSRLSHVEHMLT